MSSKPAFVTMTSAELRLCLQRLQWTYTDAAVFFDVTTRTFDRYANGDTPIPRATAIVLRIMSARAAAMLPETLLHTAPITGDLPHAPSLARNPNHR